MFVWSLFAIFSSCKEFWRIIDTKQSPFKTTRWEGWGLSSMQTKYFAFNTISTDRRSPFKKLNTLADITNKVNNFIHPDLIEERRNDGHAFYKFNINCFRMLFDHDDYESKVIITNSTDRINAQRDSDVKIVIVISKDSPANGLITLDNIFLICM